MIAVLEEIKKEIKEETTLKVEEHNTDYTVAIVLIGSLRDIGSYVENYMRQFCPSKFNTRVLSRRFIDFEEKVAEWVITRNTEELTGGALTIL